MSDFQWVEAENLKAHEKLPTWGPLREAIIIRRIAETHERIFKRLGYWLPKALEMQTRSLMQLGNVPPPHVCAHEDDELVFVTPQQPDDPPPHHLTAHEDPYQ